MLHTTSPWLTYFIIGNVYLSLLFTHFTHPPTCLPYGNHQALLWVFEFSLALFTFFFFPFIFISWRLILYNIVVVFVIHWHESAMDLHVVFVSYMSYISKIKQYLSFPVWLISLSKITSSSTYAVTNDISLIFMAKQYSYVCVYTYPSHILYTFIHQWTQIVSTSWLL